MKIFLLLFLFLIHFAEAKVVKQRDSIGRVKREIHYETKKDFIVYDYDNDGFLTKKTPYRSGMKNGTGYDYDMMGRPQRITFYKDGAITSSMSFQKYMQLSQKKLESAAAPLSYASVSKKYNWGIQRLWDFRYYILGVFFLLYLLKKTFSSQSGYRSTSFQHSRNLSRYEVEPELLAPAPRAVLLGSVFKKFISMRIFLLLGLFCASYFVPKILYVAILFLFFTLYQVVRILRKTSLLREGLLTTGTIEHIEFLRKIPKAKTRIHITYKVNEVGYKRTIEFSNVGVIFSRFDQISLLVDPRNPQNLIVYQLSPIKVSLAA